MADSSDTERAAAERDASPDGEIGDEAVAKNAMTLDEAISIIGEETRARILVELGERVRHDGVGPTSPSFSELMDAVGIDDSGRFNYHLDKLVGTYVMQVEERFVETEDAEHGYMLRPSGWLVYQALVTGALVDTYEFEPFEADPCPDCGEQLLVEYLPDGVLSVSCDACEAMVFFEYVSDRALEGRSGEAVLDAAIRRERHNLALFRQNTCHQCTSSVERNLWIDLPEMWDVIREHEVYATLICNGCGDGFVGHPATVAATTLPAISFFEEHGYDASTQRNWTGPLGEALDRTEIVSRDPVEVRVPFELDGERLTIRLDDTLRVTEAERSSK